MSSDTFKLLALPDVHVPYHHHPSWACALDVARRWRPDGCVQLGDFSSFDSVSAYPIDPKRILPYPDEVAGSNAALDELDAALKAGGCVRENKWILEGNHETRLSRYIAAHAPVLAGAIDWQHELRLDQRGWKTLPYKESLAFGELRISHDFGRAGVNAARQSLLDVGTNVLFGHTHRGQVVYQGQQSGKRHVGCTAGWLGDPEAIDYRHRDLVRRDSQHGLAVLHFLASGEFWLQFVPIVGGRCVIDGVIYSA